MPHPVVHGEPKKLRSTSHTPSPTMPAMRSAIPSILIILVSVYTYKGWSRLNPIKMLRAGSPRCFWQMYSEFLHVFYLWAPVNPLTSGMCTWYLFFFRRQIFGRLFCFGYLGLKTPQILVRKTHTCTHILRERVNRDWQKTSAKFHDPSPKYGVDIWAFVRKTCKFA